MRILQLTVHLSPNIGGVETHLNDLINSLIQRKWKVFVLAYQPLSTRVSWKLFEREKDLIIFRIPWLRGLFEKLVHYPLFEFVYLVPGLFFVTPFIILIYKPEIIHAHGLSAAVSAVFWGKLLRKRSIISLHSVYSFPKHGLYRDFVRLLLVNSDYVLCLSKKSNDEIKRLGVSENKTSVFTYWIDLEHFKFTPAAKKTLGWINKYTVIFVGRLIEEKGIRELIESVTLWNNKIELIIIGSGPMESFILEKIKKIDSIKFIGKIDQKDLPVYYSAADCSIIPSTSEEGFGRVIIESLACGTPVIASNKGATQEAMDETVGKFIKVSPTNIKEAVEDFYKHPNKVKELSKRTRQFVKRRYSESNVQEIIKAYAE